MKKYKFKLDQKVYPVGTKKIYQEGTKHRQKWEGIVVNRYRDEVFNDNLYVVKTNLGIYLVKESGLTTSKEKLLYHLLIKDVNVFEILKEKPEVIPEGAKLFSIMGILND